MCVNVVLVSVTIASHQWLMRPGLMGDTWAFPDFDWYGTTEPSTGPWFMVRRFFLYPVSHRISPMYINCLAAHLAMCLSTLADPLSLRGVVLYFRTLKLPKVTSRQCTNTWLNNRSQRWAEIFVGTLHIKATDTYIQMSSVVRARIEKRHLGILGRGAREQMSPYYAALLTCITDVGTFLNKVYLRSFLARAGYWVWYFLGTERIASISLKTFVLFRTKFQYVIISSTSVSL